MGGHPTSLGVVRSGVLFRADAPARATADDLVLLQALGVTLVIDLRGTEEAESFGASPWDVTRVHLPVCDTGRDILTALSGPGLAPGMAEKTMLAMYRDFVADEQQRGYFAHALRVIAEERGSPVFFHCTAGKDRTGWLAALLLSALGVDREAIIADYLLTNERFTTGRGAVGRQQLLEAISGYVPDVSVILPLLEARAEYLAAAFGEAEQRYGSIEAFLADELHADVESLRANLITGG